jgi:hypothetical protein
MITTDSVIDLLGGTKAVASALSLPLPTVSTWRKRGIPSARWLPLSRLAEERGVEGITLDALARMAAAEEART